jgi:hypothetical protein
VPMKMLLYEQMICLNITKVSQSHCLKNNTVIPKLQR